MFVLGGSLCDPDTRHASVPATDPDQWPRELDRVLILGGCTDWLVETLAERECEITVVEAARHVEQAQRWEGAGSVQSIDGVDGLDDFAASWYDAIFLLGGTIHTGGRFVGPDVRWSALRDKWLRQVYGLVSQRGRIVIDTLAEPDTAVRAVAATLSSDGQLALVEGVVMANNHSPRLLLRTSAFDGDGVQCADAVECVEWVPVGAHLDQHQVQAW